MDRLEQIGMEILNTTLLEWIAVLTGLFYVILMARKRHSAWFFAGISSGVYVYVCYVNQLYLESILQAYYLFMAVYGWYIWRKKASTDQFIVRWSFRRHILFILTCTQVALLAGIFFDSSTNQAFPYTDAFVTVFSLGATFMVTQRVLENWLYWIVIDTVSVYLFFSRDLNMTSLLFVAYTLISIEGYIRWRRECRKQTKV